MNSVDDGPRQGAGTACGTVLLNELALRVLEEELLGLMQGEFSNLTLMFNEHACNYASVLEMEVQGRPYYDIEDFVSEDEHRTAITTNSVWTLRWFPVTPVGSYERCASSLPALIAGVRAEFRT